MSVRPDFYQSGGYLEAGRKQWELLNQISLHNVRELSKKEAVGGCQTIFLSPQSGGNLAAGKKQPMG